MSDHKIVSREAWDAARDKLLVDEKEHTRRGDLLARRRRELPWVRVEKNYALETGGGPRTLAELFDDRTQLAVYHFMFGPDYEAGCPTCSSVADCIDAVLPHLGARDVTMMCVSSGPIETLLAYRKRMGWSFNWASSSETDFNSDLGFSSSAEETRQWVTPNEGQLPPIAARNARESGTDLVGYLRESFGFSVFGLQDGTVYQTYATTGRGIEFLMGYYGILDRVPRGRNEGDDFQVWIRRHDEYGAQRIP